MMASLLANARPPGPVADYAELGAARPHRIIRFLLPGAIAAVALIWGYIVAVADVNGLYLCTALIGCAFVLLDFRIGVVLLVVLMPISASSIFPHSMMGITGLNPLNLLLVGTLGACLLHGLFDGTLRRFLPQQVLWLYLLPIIVGAAIGVQHLDQIAPAFLIMGYVDIRSVQSYLIVMVIKPLFMVVFGLLVGAAVARSRDPERFIAPTLVSIWLMCFTFIISVALSGASLSQLSSSGSRDFLSELLGMHANDLGRLYAFAYALLLFMFVEAKRASLKVMLLASMVLVVGALMLTFSRGAFVGFLVVNLLFLLWRLNPRTILLFIVAAAGLLLLLPDAVYERITTGFGGGVDAISAGRVSGIWLQLVPEIGKSPVFGNGIGSIMWSDFMRRQGGSTVAVLHHHNAYLQAYFDVGLAGLTLLLGYVVHLWRGFRKLARDPQLSSVMRGFFLGAAAGLAGLLVAGMAGSSLMPKPEHAFLWLAIGVMYGYRTRKQAK